MNRIWVGIGIGWLVIALALRAVRVSHESARIIADLRARGVSCRRILGGWTSVGYGLLQWRTILMVVK